MNSPAVYLKTFSNEKIALDTLRLHAQPDVDNPHNVYILSEITRTGLGFYQRLFVPALIGGKPAIYELTGPIQRVSGNPYKERGGELWLCFKGTYNPSAAANLLAIAQGVKPELIERVYRVLPL